MRSRLRKTSEELAYESQKREAKQTSDPYNLTNKPLLLVIVEILERLEALEEKVR